MKKGVRLDYCHLAFFPLTRKNSLAIILNSTYSKGVEFKPSLLKFLTHLILSTIIYILNNDRANQKPVRSILLIMKKLKEDIIFEALQ